MNGNDTKQISAAEEIKNVRNSALTDMIAAVKDPNTKDYINRRILPQMDWYSKSSRKYKKKYDRAYWTAMILGALTAVTALFIDNGFISNLAITAMIVVLCLAVLSLNVYLFGTNSKDLWLNYRNTREVLLRTLYFYFNNADKFSGMESEAEKDRTLIESCEYVLSRENDTWRSRMEK